MNLYDQRKTTVQLARFSGLAESVTDTLERIFLGTPDPGFLSEYASRIDAAQNIVFGMKRIKDWRCKSETAPVFSHYEIKVST
jgi:hypothetical protein